jgi:hypothetical protein
VSERARRLLPRGTGTALVLAAALLFGGCERGSGRAWNAEAGLAVALRVRGAYPEACVLVARSVGGPAGGEMPFALYQALVTAGFVVEEPGVDVPGEGEVLLELLGMEREGEGWAVRARTTVAPTGPPALLQALEARWSVTCDAERCRVADSVPVASETRDASEAPSGPQGCARPEG